MTQPRPPDAKRAKILEELKGLSESERRLLSKVLEFNRANLHLDKPGYKEELLKAVREFIK